MTLGKNAGDQGGSARVSKAPFILLRKAVVIVAALMATNGALASADQDRALSALEAHQILPLSKIIAFAALGDDRLLHADLKREASRYIYELRVIATDGTIRLRHLDAGTGEILPDGKLSDHPVGQEQD
ncbi:hypothetical protein CU048_02300 [Beijerinckiaceae bacterium]|nr:hypothetical protein CU048_02300 [Beijerinckiaceae bacterium]